MRRLLADVYPEGISTDVWRTYYLPTASDFGAIAARPNSVVGTIAKGEEGDPVHMFGT